MTAFEPSIYSSYGSYGNFGAWSSSGPSSLSKAGLDMLIKSEGIRGTIYDDKTGKSVSSYSEVQGYPTIALGLYITPEMQSTYARYLKGGEILSGSALQDVIDKTIQPREQQLNKLLSGIPNVTQNQYDALFSWLFNRGASNKRLLNAIAKLRAGDVSGAGEDIAAAASAESVPYIAARRVQESVLFLTGANIGSTTSKVVGITLMSVGIAGILGAVYWRKKHRNPLNLSGSSHVSIYTE